jgi:glycosyltransferase involved in cell wall biosynthesis
MKDYPKITIITPNRNGAAFLEQTILSVIGQGYPNLEYIVMDGDSSDNSREIIERHSSGITFWESCPDGGLYHALQKGFERSSGEIMGWINSDDILLPGSLFSIAEIFTLSEKIEWIQGHPVVVDENGRFVYQRPPVYRPDHFLAKKYHDGRFIQQESTFWRRSLWERAGGYISREYSYAGDFELWMRFFRFAGNFQTTAMLGAFRTRKEGQISKSYYQEYLKQCDDIIENLVSKNSENNPEIIDFVKNTDSNNQLITYDFAKNNFRL